MSAADDEARRHVHWWVMATWLLLGLCLGAAVFLAAESTAGMLVTVALFVPWLLPLRGLLRRDRRTHAWATLCVAPYFIYGMTEAVANPALRAAAAAILFASLGHFLALVAYLRVTRSVTRDQAAPSP